MISENILVLFDIDGTLLHPGSGARQSLSQAIHEEIGQQLKIEPGFCAGKTDLLIISSLLEKAGCLVQEIQPLMKSVIKRYLELLETNYNAKNDAYMYEGALELIEALNERPEVFLGLLTGNVEKGARIKLGPFGVNDLLPTGAFGEDGFDRTDLSRVAVNRAEAEYGVQFLPKNISVIGDTVADIKCGKVIDAKSIVVSQHLRNEEELIEANPDFLFTDLVNTENIVHAICDKKS
ncbi:haloacid dehalogenase-like hydrolase [candidate division KSB1 bacterium]|nr:haloacid dehalogenase-like hydrolase [candidate division KSB1 bacterium]